MNDKFTDRIRRKLESAGPPAYTEQAWQRLQQAMQQPPTGDAPPSPDPVAGAGSGAASTALTALPWLWPVLSVVTVASLLGVIYWQARTNQALRQEIARLNQRPGAVGPTAVAPERSERAAAPGRTDTVYVMRPAPSDPRNVVDDATVAQAERSGPRSRFGGRAEPPVRDKLAPAQRSEGPAHAPLRPESPTGNRAGEPDAIARVAGNGVERPAGADTATHQPVVDGAVGNPATTLLPPTGALLRRPAGALDKRTTTRPRADQRGSRNTSPTSGVARTETLAAPDDRSVGAASPATTLPGRPSTDKGADKHVVALSGQLPDNAPVTIPLNVAPLRPRSLPRDSAYVRAGYVRQQRRIRRWLPAAAPTAAPTPLPEARTAPQDGSSVSTTWRWRVGLAGDVGQGQGGGGLVAEVRLGSRWRVGAGLGVRRWSGETYSTDFDYDQRTRHNFRRFFARSLDPRSTILNINPSARLWQVPIWVSYELALGRGWSVVPTLGAELAASGRETIRFSYLRNPRELEQQTIGRAARPGAWHTGSVSVAVERTWGRVSLQAGPYLSVPLRATTPDRPNLGPILRQPAGRGNVLTGGLRARVLYSF